MFNSLKICLIFIGILGLSVSLEAQRFPHEFWHEGKVVLLEGDTLFGDIKYDLERDVIQLRRGADIMEAFSARKILFFEIFDETISQYRLFFALPFAISSNYKAPVFFEVLFEGKLTLLNRESIQIQNVTYYDPRFSRYYHDPFMRGMNYPVLVYNFYFLNEKGQIAEFSKKKRDLYRIMRNRQQDIKAYIKKERLKVDRIDHLIKITRYYNSLITPN